MPVKPIARLKRSSRICTADRNRLCARIEHCLDSAHRLIDMLDNIEIDCELEPDSDGECEGEASVQPACLLYTGVNLFYTPTGSANQTIYGRVR